MKTRLDALLAQKGVTADQLASLTQLPNDRIDAMIGGRWLASPQDRSLIAEALEVSVDQVIWGHTMDPRNIRYRQYGLREDF